MNIIGKKAASEWRDPSTMPTDWHEWHNKPFLVYTKTEYTRQNGEKGVWLSVDMAVIDVGTNGRLTTWNDGDHLQIQRESVVAWSELLIPDMLKAED